LQKSIFPEGVISVCSEIMQLNSEPFWTQTLPELRRSSYHLFFHYFFPENSLNTHLAA